MRSTTFSLVLGGSALMVMTAAACGGAPPAQSASVTTSATVPDTVHVAIARDGTTTFAGKPADTSELLARTHETVAARPNVKMVVDAEREVAFQVVMTTVERLRQGGATQVAFGSIIASPPTGVAPSTQASAPKPATGPTPEPHASVPVGTRWDCPFPGERAGKNEANVLVRVHVENDGKPLSVDVLEDPGAGYGPAAKRCALDKAYLAARDVNGQPVRATTFPFYIHFVQH